MHDPGRDWNAGGNRKVSLKPIKSKWNSRIGDSDGRTYGLGEMASLYGLAGVGGGGVGGGEVVWGGWWSINETTGHANSP